MRQREEGNWRVEAACRDDDPDLYFPVGSGAAARRQVAEAKRACRSCPVQAECRTEGLSMPRSEGIWGGLRLPDERPVQSPVPRPKLPPAHGVNRWLQGGPPVDTVVTERLAAGKPVARYTMQERDHAARIMAANGDGLFLIGRRLKMNGLTLAAVLAENTQGAT